jgi:hypothetical protein
VSRRCGAEWGCESYAYGGLGGDIFCLECVYTWYIHLHSYPTHIYSITQQSISQLFYSDVLLLPLSILGSKELINKALPSHAIENGMACRTPYIRILSIISLYAFLFLLHLGLALTFQIPIHLASAVSTYFSLTYAIAKLPSPNVSINNLKLVSR